MNDSFFMPPMVSRLSKLNISLDFVHTQAIYLFGSQAMNTANASSDCDLAVLCDGKLDAMQTWQAAQALSLELGVEVDLIDLRSASTVMQHQIIATGQRIFCEPSSALAVGLFEAYVLNEYLDFNRRRASLLADIALTGKIYAA